MAQQPAKPTEAQNQTIETLNPNTTHAQAQHHSGTATHTFGGSRTRTRVTPRVFGFHICTAFHEHEHHASIRELISHET